MNYVINLITLSASIIAAYPAILTEKCNPIVSHPKQQYAVQCRCIKQNDTLTACPTLTIPDGEKGCISISSQTPLVTGLTRVHDSGTNSFVNQPHIIYIEEGMKIDLMVAGRQLHGATLDVTVEQTKISKVDAKLCTPNSIVQIPSIDIEKKRIIDFVKFGEKLVVPIGEKSADGSKSCLEFVVYVAENKPVDNLVMGGVTPRILIQEEEEEHLDIVQP